MCVIINSRSTTIKCNLEHLQKCEEKNGRDCFTLGGFVGLNKSFFFVKVLYMKILVFKSSFDSKSSAFVDTLLIRHLGRNRGLTMHHPENIIGKHAKAMERMNHEAKRRGIAT